jgi:ribonuclease E
MSDENVPEARQASDEPVAVARPEQGEGGPAPSGGGEDGVVVRKRRRRGSRGGRNRRRPASANPSNSESSGDPENDGDGGGDGDSVDLTEKAGSAGGRQGRSQPRSSSGARRASSAPATADAAADDAAPAPDTSDGQSGPREVSLRNRPGPEAGGRSRTAAASAAASLEISAPAAPVPAADAPTEAAAGDGDGAAATSTTPSRRRRSRGRGRGGRGRGGGDGSGSSSGSGGGGAATAEKAATGSTPATGRSRGRGGAPAAEKARQSEVEAMLDELDEAAIERRRGRTRKGRPTGRYLMCVSVKPGVGTQVAVLEGRSLVEHYVSRPTDTNTQIDGNIYLGKVQNVLPGMEAAFVDIGTPKNGVLYRDDVVFDETEIEGRRPKIERLLRNGQSVVVQVTKNPIGTKGARLTQEVSLAGRFVVMIPNQPGTYGISKRLSDDERKRLRKILDEIRPAENGLIVRTAADGASADELARDLRRLSAQWDEISKTAARNKPARLLHQEPDLAIRVIREEFNKEYRGVVIDDPALYEEIRRYVEAITPELADRVELYQDPLPIFERYHVHEQLHKALERKVWLPSGGSIIIERTEALTVIDVNTAKNVGRSNLEETVFANNLEAAEEVARQLRLRDIGGIIVIDFIDMEIKKNREEVLRKFKEALARDKTRTQVFDISELGLVEMTRKRISEGLVEAFSTTCPSCEGRGIILDDTLL